ncbi:ganglioside GM2 activator-like [Saccostrea echinata]|uniref:ganglioside GM2 activator-like n=1 Tax=Saccostrea echinata TaxID=191078 RepID=UPI002A83D853|nr:ganglioside GM2 activator-like [Saccostrea echinata]
MYRFCWVAGSVAVIVAALAIQGSASFRKLIEDDTELFLNFLKHDVLPERYRSTEYFKNIGKTVKVQAFSFKNCGGNFAGISKLQVVPDPLKLPGNFNVSAIGYMKEGLKSPLQASLLIHKKAAGVWVKIPCIGDFGSCDYDDFCEILDMASECPDAIQKSGLGCQCPFKQGNYSIPNINMYGSFGFPTGDYNLTGTLHYQGKYVACLEIILTIAT